MWADLRFVRALFIRVAVSMPSSGINVLTGLYLPFACYPLRVLFLSSAPCADCQVLANDM